MHPLRRPLPQQFALWLAIAAVLLRALIPDGFMPEHRKGEGLALAICSAGPLSALRLPDQLLSEAGKRGAPGRHDTAHHEACPYASAAAPGLVSGPTPGLASLAAQAHPRSAFTASALLAASRLRPPARAPPRIS